MIRRNGSERCNAWYLIHQQAGFLLSQHRARSEIHMLVHYFRNRNREECDCKDMITISLGDSPKTLPEIEEQFLGFVWRFGFFAQLQARDYDAF